MNGTVLTQASRQWATRPDATQEPDGLAPIKYETMWWGERVGICTACGKSVVIELQTNVAGRAYHRCVPLAEVR